MIRDKFYYKAHAEKRREQGLCQQCNNPTYKGGRECEWHGFRNRTRKNGMSAEKSKTLFETRTCSYTNKKLPLEELAVDHIVPRSKGGSDSDDNLTLVDKRINSLKLDYTKEEFITLCNIIIQSIETTPVLKKQLKG